jgi:hypothetical protein
MFDERSRKARWTGTPLCFFLACFWLLSAAGALERLNRLILLI